MSHVPATIMTTMRSAVITGKINGAGSTRVFQVLFFVAPFEKKEFIMDYHIRPLENGIIRCCPIFYMKQFMFPKDGRSRPKRS